jgi:hypothetical protein
MISQGALLSTEPPPIRAALFLEPILGISAIPPEEPPRAEVIDSLSAAPLELGFGLELDPLAVSGGEELDPDDGMSMPGIESDDDDDEVEPPDGGARVVVLDPAEEPNPAVLFDPAEELDPKDVLLELAKPPREVLLEPADELALGDKSESGKGGVEVPGDEELESGEAGTGELVSGAGVEASPDAIPPRPPGIKPPSKEPRPLLSAVLWLV